MDLLVMLLATAIITVLSLPYITDGTYADSQSLTSTVISNSSFVAQDLPYCEPSLCRKVQCFTYYQEVLGLWH